MEDRRIEDLTNAIDRGGLCHVTNDVFSIFCLIEEEIRRHFLVQDAKHMREGDKKNLVEKLKSNRELHSQWSMLSTREDDSVHMVVLDMIIAI